jgi:hypothetical protein
MTRTAWITAAAVGVAFGGVVFFAPVKAPAGSGSAVLPSEATAVVADATNAMVEAPRVAVSGAAIPGAPTPADAEGSADYAPSGDVVAVSEVTASFCTPGGTPGAPAFKSARDRSAIDDDPAVKTAIEKALKWLAKEQAPTGAWIEDLGYKFNDGYNITGKSRPHVGVTALALMAFLSGGHLPGRGAYGKTVERGTDYLLSCVDEQDGYIAFEGSRMYSHAFATLYLAEILGMTHRADLKQKLQLAVNLTAASQNERGSWRYEPHSPESDMSITVCQVMALRAARNVGIRVNKKVIDNAYDYVVRSAERGQGSERGGFHYQEKDRTRTSFALTAAGVASLHNTGIYEHDLIRAGIDYLKRQMPWIYRQYAGHYFYWYGHYYAAQVFFTASDPANPSQDLWSSFYWPKMKKELLETKVDTHDGASYWKNTTGPGDAFSTAVAAIILQIPYQYLPIFQR